MKYFGVTETLLDRLWKIKRMSKSANKHESRTARLLLDQLLKKFNIRDEDVVSNEPKKYEFKTIHEEDKQFHLGVFRKVLKTKEVKYGTHKDDDLHIIIELKPAHYLFTQGYIETYHQWFLDGFEKAKSKYFIAFIFKYNMDHFDDVQQNQQESPYDEDDIMEIQEMMMDMFEIIPPERQMR